MPGIDLVVAFRFIFAIGVVLLHFGEPWLQSLGASDRLVESLNSPFRLPFFFVTSGFLLAYTAGHPEGLAWKSFMLRRMIRVYPAYLVALGAWFLLDLLHAPQLGFPETRSADYLRHALLLQPWFGAEAILRLNGPAWYISSLLVYAALLPMILRRSPPVLAGLSLAALALPMAVSSWGSQTLVQTLSWETGPPVVCFALVFLSCLGAFGLGAAGAKVRLASASARWNGGGAVLLLAFLGCALLLPTATTLAFRSFATHPAQAAYAAQTFVYSILMAAIVYWTSWRQRGVPRLARNVGEWSLGILLFHWPWYRLCWGVAVWLDTSVPFPFYLASLLVLCAFVVRPFERWANRILSSQATRRGSTVTTPPATP